MAAITSRIHPDIEIALQEKFYTFGTFKNSVKWGVVIVPTSQDCCKD